MAKFSVSITDDVAVIRIGASSRYLCEFFISALKSRLQFCPRLLGCSLLDKREEEASRDCSCLLWVFAKIYKLAEALTLINLLRKTN